MDIDNVKFEYIDWNDFLIDCHHMKCIAAMFANPDGVILGVSRGGLIPATIISHFVNLPFKVVGVKSYKGMRCGDIEFTQPFPLDDEIPKQVIIVDDLVDTGRTISYLVDYLRALRPDVDIIVITAYIKKNFIEPEGIDLFHIEEKDKDTWLVFPYEYNAP